MKNPFLLVLFFSILLVSCSDKTDGAAPDTGKIDLNKIKVDSTIKRSEDKLRENKAEKELPFAVDFSLEPVNGSQYNLAVNLVMKDSGSYVFSTTSNDGFSIPFDFLIKENESVLLGDSLLEFPASIEEFFPELEMLVKLIKVNTTFKRSLVLTSQKDFDVRGVVEFMYEPICIPYYIEFVLKQRSGKLSLEKTNTMIYRGKYEF